VGHTKRSDRSGLRTAPYGPDRERLVIALGRETGAINWYQIRDGYPVQWAPGRGDPVGRPLFSLAKGTPAGSWERRVARLFIQPQTSPHEVPQVGVGR
jgi:hypothetical protein